MKSFLLLIVITVTLSIFSGCTPTAAPSADIMFLEYSADASESGLRADISYRNELNEIVALASEPLPWSISLTLNDDFTGNVYLNVELPETEVFKPFASGNADGIYSNRLIDSTADFNTLGVIIGDRIYSDPSSATSSSVTKIFSSDTLQLDADLFETGTEPYFIYHKKELTARALLNDETVGIVVSEGFKRLSALVKTSIDR